MRGIMHIPYIFYSPSLTIEQAAEVLSLFPVCGKIDCVDWNEHFPAHPHATLRLAHTGEMLFVRFDVEGRGLRAMHTTDLEHVNEDSCVEFFVTNVQGTRYFNFEFNCVGVCNASHRISKAEDVYRLTSEELQSVVRWSSLTSSGVGEAALAAPFDKRKGNYTWSLTIGVPLRMLGVTEDMLVKTVRLRGNFYKCGDKTVEPHYLSWNPIYNEQPNFHLPEFFGELLLEPASQMPNKDKISAEHLGVCKRI